MKDQIPVHLTEAERDGEHDHSVLCDHGQALHRCIGCMLAMGWSEAKIRRRRGLWHASVGTLPPAVKP